MAKAKKTSAKPAKAKSTKSKPRSPKADQPVTPTVVIGDEAADQLPADPEPFASELPDFSPKRHHHWVLLGSVPLILLALVAGFELVYAGKVFPGVSADGIYVSGLSRAAATAEVTKQTANYAHQIPVTYPGGRILVKAVDIGTDLGSRPAVDQAMAYGRAGDWRTRLSQRWDILWGRPVDFAAASFEAKELAPLLRQLSDRVESPVVNARFSFNGAAVQIVPGRSGRRLDAGRLAQGLADQFGRGSGEPLAAPVYDLAPVIEASDLAAARDQVATLAEAPLNLAVGAQSISVDQDEITSWLAIGRQARPLTKNFELTDFYSGQAPVELALEPTKVAGYVARLAAKLDQPAVDAALTIADGKAVVFRPSQSGAAIDQPAAVAQIRSVLNNPSADRHLTLAVKTLKPTVSEDSLNELGIKELISEGVTFFPGSPANRQVNIKVGASKFNGTLVKNGEVFSFDTVLGPVEASTGYLPEIVILQGHEEKQYGGGLCQVSTTAYRAALLAGLPILARTNHSFAVGYYTAPYGIPGVDATIYPPSPDMKFRNDTGSAILIQTVVSGSTLKFQFYGTKTKTSVIRGPQFISGTLDHTQPSHTVFWRDVVALDGSVTKTDTVETWYKSSKEFPLTPSLN